MTEPDAVIWAWPATMTVARPWRILWQTPAMSSPASAFFTLAVAAHGDHVAGGQRPAYGEGGGSLADSLLKDTVMVHSS